MSTILVVCALISFYPLKNASFLIGWDDQWFVTNHYTEDGLSWANIRAIFTEFYHGQYAPINQLYYTVLYTFFDYRPVVFHLFCILIHLANAFLVYKFILRISRQLFICNEEELALMAFITALLFTTSPFNLEPVAWISASKVTIYAFFYLLGLLCYIKYITQFKNKYFYFSIILMLTSFGSKEQAVSFPLAMILLDFVFKRNFKESTVYYEKVPVLILCLLFGLVTIQSQGVVQGGNNFYPIHQKLVLMFFTIIEYFIKTVLPIRLSYLYPYPFAVGSAMPVWIYIYPIFTALKIWLLYPVLKKPGVIFGVVFFLINILLVSNIVSLARHSIIADRYAYLASIGIYFIIGRLVTLLYARAKLKRPIVIIFLLYLGFFVLYTNVHSYVWFDAISLKENIREKIKTRNDFKKWNKSKHIQ